MKRTILIANTSNMPVAAREASIYTGITIAEYFRDMGYHVALMADSTSRWAEALREMSGRLEEMPGEEGYPAYLPTRMADFYERAGLVKVIGSKEQEGSLSSIGAVSPPGGDMSDPVVQATLKIVKTFWGLDANLAYRRHFPAINWLLSYSLYHDNLEEYFTRGKGLDDWRSIRIEAMALLHKESELEEIVRLVGTDSLSPSDQLVLSITKSIREDFLYQNAFHKQDSYTSLAKQYRMLKLIIFTYHQFQKALEAGCSLAQLTGLPIMEKMAKMKFLEEKDLSVFDSYQEDLKNQIASVVNK